MDKRLAYYKEINKLIIERNFTLCDSFLSEGKTYDAGYPLLIGLLRLTYAWKDKLPSWSSLLDRAKAEIENKGNNSDLLLKGLL